MALVPLTVRRVREIPGGPAVDISGGEVRAIDDSQIQQSKPSVGKKDGVDDASVNSVVLVSGIAGKELWWCEETTAAIALLS